MFKLVGNEGNKPFMEKYMRNQFPFLGVKTPERKAQSKELIRQSKQLALTELFAEIDRLYQREEREYQYVAIYLAYANVNRLEFTDLKKLTAYIQLKSWWDTVDAWRKIFGTYVVKHPAEKDAVFHLFYAHDNFWMRRVGILLQLLEKETLDPRLLTQAIEYDSNTDEFFIQKVIGWALRNYSKYDPAWVKMFIKRHSLSQLAVKEGSKVIDKQ